MSLIIIINYMGKNNHKGFDNFVQNLIRGKEDKAPKKP